MDRPKKAQEYRDRAAFLRQLAKSNAADVAASLMRVAEHYDEIAEMLDPLHDPEETDDT